MALTLDLPTSRLVERPYREIENVLAQMRIQVESRYNQKIAVLLLTVNETDAHEQLTLHRYVVKLSFVYRNYEKTIMELDCNVGHGYPVAIRAHQKEFGQASNKVELEKLIELVFSDFRTRNIIMINY